MGRNLGFSCLFFSLKGTPHPHLTLIRSSPAIEKKNYEIFPEKKKGKRHLETVAAAAAAAAAALPAAAYPVPLRSGSVAFRYRVKLKRRGGRPVLTGPRRYRPV